MIKHFLKILVVTFAIVSVSHASDTKNPRVEMETSMGNITIVLFADKAPVSVANFLKYVDSGFYNGTIFHRVIDGFMIQGGGFTTDFEKKETEKPIINEADNMLRNNVGMVAMARTSDPHSATSQFFINVKNNTSLDYREKTLRGWGYAVFGRVVRGMDVIKKIKSVKTGSFKGYRDVPETQVVIKSVKRIPQ